jgi:hypothetical protein
MSPLAPVNSTFKPSIYSAEALHDGPLLRRQRCSVPEANDRTARPSLCRDRFDHVHRQGIESPPRG